MNKRHYVTLFDSKYLLRGLALYESLCLTTKNFVLHMIAFDPECYEKLTSLNLKNADIISLEEFEDEELLSVKETRSKGEYCWTSTAKSILYVLDKEQCSDCTYLDSDLYFFHDPEFLIAEIPKEKSVLITEHRYTPEYDQTEVSGKYCVQFMFFKNDEKGRNALTWWKDRCIEWCYATPEDGKLGDQKYLDDWMVRFEGIHELRHLGGGIAPWNIQQYNFYREDTGIKFFHQKTGIRDNVIFYHFHRLEFFEQDVVRLTSDLYKIPSSGLHTIYKDYIRKCAGLCYKYNLYDNIHLWRNESTYFSDVETMFYDKNFFAHSLFL